MKISLPATRIFKGSDPETIFYPKTKKLRTEPKSVGGLLWAAGVGAVDTINKFSRPIKPTTNKKGVRKTIYPKG